MAEHPHRYGQFPGHYPPIPSSSSTPSSYYYPPPQVGAMSHANYTTTQSAYDQNSTRIPGLGLGGTPIAPIAPFPPNISQPWLAQGHNAQVNSYFQGQQQPTSSLPQPPHIPHQQSQNTLEEGELGEGEFEDLYEPKASTNPGPASHQNQPTQPSQHLDSRSGSVGDADGSSIYDPNDPHVAHEESGAHVMSNKLPDAEGDTPPEDEWEPSYQDRERSGSYSPYLSPREVHRKISVAKVVPRDTKATTRVESSQSTHSKDAPSPIIPSVMPPPNGTTIASSDPNRNAVLNSTAGPEHGTNSSSPFRSPLEAKKKAQEAILGMWPLKVRYQDYIDEGVDATVVRALFKDIGLDVPISKATTAPIIAMDATQSTSTNTTVSPSISLGLQSPPTNQMPASLPKVKQPDKKDSKDQSSDIKVTKMSTAEERKDKIARKLAAMAQKATAAQPAGQGAPVPTPTPMPEPVTAPTTASATIPAPPGHIPISAPLTVPIIASNPVDSGISVGTKSDATNTPSTVTKTRAENNAILQQKLAALKKQQAQLAADKARTASNESTTNATPLAADAGSLDTSRNGNLTPKARSATSTDQSMSQQDPSNEPQDNPKKEGIPGLSFSSLVFPQPAQGSIRSLKRPVASDFDDYMPRFEPPKRTRTDERLIIDVSDDEDIEMEIGSPTDELPPSTTSSVAPSRPALGAIPPPDGPNRRPGESPASSPTPTPPIHPTKIILLHKRIAETKRLIAEAEAKKAAKKATIQLSPKPSSPAAQQPVNPTMNQGGGSDAKKTIHNRRDRIVSYELPRVNAALKEKQDKLKLLVAEAEQLELEVRASLDEQQKLSMEMECLLGTSMEISPEPDHEQQSQFKDSEHHGLERRLRALSTHAGVVTPPGQATASPSQQEPEGSDCSKPQLSHSRESPLANVNGDTDAEINNDEALQAAILTDTNFSMDIQMAGTDAPISVTDHVPSADSAPIEIPPNSLGISSSTQLSTTEAETEIEQTPKEIPPDAGIQTDSAAELTPPAMSAPSSESDAGSSESDVSMQQSVQELSQSDDEPYEPTPAPISDSHGTPKAQGNTTEVADDVLGEPNPNYTMANQDHREPQDTNNQEAQSHAPLMEDLLSYKSPLSYFRAYRFHPKYFEEVPGGLKSMTFSAKIDPNLEVCPQVLAGESCPKGASCEYQHFDSMVLADAEIITQLGSADMFVGEARTKFIEGLKRVLNDLKANRVKDFDRITKAIVKHRQEFLGDTSKVLALGSSAT